MLITNQNPLYEDSEKVVWGHKQLMPKWDLAKKLSFHNYLLEQTNKQATCVLSYLLLYQSH